MDWIRGMTFFNKCIKNIFNDLSLYYIKKIGKKYKLLPVIPQNYCIYTYPIIHFKKDIS